MKNHDHLLPPLRAAIRRCLSSLMITGDAPDAQGSGRIQELALALLLAHRVGIQMGLTDGQFLADQVFRAMPVELQMVRRSKSQGRGSVVVCLKQALWNLEAWVATLPSLGPDKASTRILKEWNAGAVQPPHSPGGSMITWRSMRCGGYDIPAMVIAAITVEFNARSLFTTSAVERVCASHLKQHAIPATPLASGLGVKVYNLANAILQKWRKAGGITYSHHDKMWRRVR